MEAKRSVASIETWLASDASGDLKGSPGWTREEHHLIAKTCEDMAQMDQSGGFGGF